MLNTGRKGRRGLKSRPRFRNKQRTRFAASGARGTVGASERQEVRALDCIPGRRCRHSFDAGSALIDSEAEDGILKSHL